MVKLTLIFLSPSLVLIPFWTMFFFVLFFHTFNCSCHLEALEFTPRHNNDGLALCYIWSHSFALFQANICQTGPTGIWIPRPCPQGCMQPSGKLYCCQVPIGHHFPKYLYSPPPPPYPPKLQNYLFITHNSALNCVSIGTFNAPSRTLLIQEELLVRLQTLFRNSSINVFYSK